MRTRAPRRVSLPALLALVVAGSSAASFGAGAENLVRFPSRDASLTGGTPTEITAQLFRPAGRGPFPAVVAMHGCGGQLDAKGRMRPHDRRWAEWLAAQGYVALFPDSFNPRGQNEICTKREFGAVWPFRERPLDALGARDWLAGQSYVDAARIAVMGWSNGGIATLRSVSQQDASAFRAAIAFYPGCAVANKDGGWRARIPLLMLIGGLDDWTAPEPCIQLAERRARAGDPISIKVYPDAYHGFDNPSGEIRVRTGLGSTKNRDGTAHVGANPAAYADATQRVSAFLAQHLRR
jgi:dienelactone hydrolase